MGTRVWTSGYSGAWQSSDVDSASHGPPSTQPGVGVLSRGQEGSSYEGRNKGRYKG